MNTTLKLYNRCGTIKVIKNAEVILLEQEMNGRERLEVRIPLNLCDNSILTGLFTSDGRLQAFDVKGSIAGCFDGFLLYAEVHREYVLLAFGGIYEYMKTKLHWSTSVDWDLFHSKDTYAYTYTGVIPISNTHYGDYAYVIYEPIDPAPYASQFSLYYLDSGNNEVFIGIYGGTAMQTINIPIIPNNGVVIKFDALGYQYSYSLTAYKTTMTQLQTLWNGQTYPANIMDPYYTNAGSQYYFTFEDPMEYGRLGVSWGGTMADILDEINENGFSYRVEGYNIIIYNGDNCKTYSKLLSYKNSNIDYPFVIYDGTKVGDYAVNQDNENPLSTEDSGFAPIITGGTCSTGEAYGLSTSTSSEVSLQSFLTDRTGSREFSVVLGDMFDYCDIPVGACVKTKYNDCNPFFNISDTFFVVKKELVNGVYTRLTLSKDVFLWREREQRRLRKLALNA